ncbi:MAG: GWxTD domain-containing protein, partial [Candidatus Latescibacteria bacterium]|nr:GWxTD domain-containing protein [Candidatus Latescibacterota bacterium]
MSVITRYRNPHPPAWPIRLACILLCVASAHAAGAVSGGTPPAAPATAEPSPADRDSLTALEEQRQRAHDDSVAIASLARRVDAHPDSAQLVCQLGYAYLKARNFDSAEKAFKAAKKLNKHLPEAYVGRGLVHVERPTRGVSALYGYRRALGEAKRATKIDSTYAPAYRLLGEIHERFQEDHDKAVGYFLKYVELAPGDPDGLYYFGLACVQARKPDVVVEHIAPSLATHANEARLLPLVAQAYFAQERYGIALEYFERYLRNLEEEERTLYTDIALVASEKELDEYRSMTWRWEQIEYLERFWRRRDPDILTRINERIIEHYRRVWFARTFFSERIHPWDRRGEVYIRYGEPDHRSRSIQRKITMNPSVDALRMRSAMDMYGHEASYLTFTGPVFPIRSRNANFGQGMLDLVAADMSVEDQDDFSVDANPTEESPFQDILQDPDAPELVQDIVQNFGDESTSEDFRDIGTPMSPFDESMNLDLNLNFGGYAPVTMKNTGSLVPWESWVYTQVNRGIEITFTDESGNGRFDFAPIPPLASIAGRRDARIASRIT